RPERFAVGQKVDARVIQFDRRARKVQVSIKALEVAEEKEAIAQDGSSDSGATLGDILGTALKRASEKPGDKEERRPLTRCGKALRRVPVTMFKTLRYCSFCHNCGRFVGAIDGGGRRPHWWSDSEVRQRSR